MAFLPPSRLMALLLRFQMQKAAYTLHANEHEQQTPTATDHFMMMMTLLRNDDDVLRSVSAAAAALSSSTFSHFKMTARAAADQATD